MSRAAAPIDAGVIIERVRVRVAPDANAARPVADLVPLARGRGRDHRIVVHELRIDSEAALGELEARRLGERIAGALGLQLAAIQDRRVAAICAGRSRGGRVEVQTLQLVLRGAEAERPDLRAITGALAAAVERGVTS